MSARKTIWLVDDHPLFLSGLKTLINSNAGYLVERAEPSAEKLLELTPLQGGPHYVLMDISLPGMSGITLCKKIKGMFPGARIIALSSHSDARVVRQMIKSGADGYLLKTVDEKELFACLEVTAGGTMYIQHTLKDLMLDSSLGRTGKTEKLAPRLTPREKDILALIVAGDTTAVIAEKLFVTTATVETHRMNLFQKLDVKNVAGLVREALENNLLD